MSYIDHIKEAGRIAGYNGKQRDCPYHEFSDNGEAWTSGYEQGALQRLADDEKKIHEARFNIALSGLSFRYLT